MSKRFWVEVKKWDKNLVTAALESGAQAVWVGKGMTPKVKELGIITVIAPDGDLKPGEDVVEVMVNSKKDEDKALRAPASKFVVVRTQNWKVIPLENLIAARGNLIASVSNSKEAKLALEIMERGADGILLHTTDVNEIKKTGKLMAEQGEKLHLVQAKITALKQLGMGDRVCVDTMTNMRPGQGMLVGNSSSGLFLVHAENVETPYCAPRPFRVNAGGVHAYVRTPGSKTAYLADLAVGDSVLVVDSRGKGEVTYVGRSKIEKRPMMLVEAVAQGQKLSLILQNAETIRLTRPGGEPVSIAKLKPGDKVLAFLEEAGRHFGMKVKETITEK
ncbi:MAG: 3-dehydroquinate synthase [Deltaproteobacteria bacterium RBG_13_61_14]|nr:MAG: 3-dehydroquinate synthase [Deltaproteobacteria bacterium RBG_13_61_14]